MAVWYNGDVEEEREGEEGGSVRNNAVLAVNAPRGPEGIEPGSAPAPPVEITGYPRDRGDLETVIACTSSI